MFRLSISRIYTGFARISTSHPAARTGEDFTRIFKILELYSVFYDFSIKKAFCYVPDMFHHQFFPKTL
jgi:hypothetical protein